MRQLYEEWQSSNLSKKLFATGHGVSPSTFYYWVAKFERVPSSSVKPAKGFKQIALDHPGVNPLTATVRYPSGVVLEWHGGSDTIDDLKALL